MESFVIDPIFKYFFIATNSIALICWVATLINDNYSQIDRLWSILPVAYSWSFMYTAYSYNQNSERTALMASLITLWGLRLTYNYWRKGGYQKGEEDYRWTHVKKMFFYPDIKILFHLFNFVFIAFIQNWLLLALAVPLWFIQTNKHSPVNFYDYLLATFFVCFYLIEVVADEQQWNFQVNKKKWNQNPSRGFSQEEIEDFKRGFLTRGLFRYSRHPNFFGELAMWWTIYMFTLTDDSFQWSNLVNYSISGALFLNLLFLQSTPLTERISVSKYPLYKEYQSQVCRIIPGFTHLNSSKLD